MLHTLQDNWRECYRKQARIRPNVNIRSYEISGNAIGITQAQSIGIDITNHSYGFDYGWSLSSIIAESNLLAGNIQNAITTDSIQMAIPWIRLKYTRRIDLFRKKIRDLAFTILGLPLSMHF